MPTLPRVYEVAKLGDESEETLRRIPRGVSKSRRARQMLDRSQICSIWIQELTSSRGRKRTVRVVAVPIRGVVEAILDIVHEIEHLGPYH